jgi:hypothetical protein
VLVAAVAGLLLGFGAFSLASAFGTGQVQDLGDPVRFDPAGVAVTPAPTPTLIPTLNPPPEQVVPAAPSPADDDADTDDDDDD